ncbi:MAG: TA system VapC family ribonuclease toxin [Vulcanimicrobiaceae bacterium]|jgi:toxin-antitoxin system PIN domain toxin
MILIDANLLVYAFDRRSPWYEQARMWLTGLLEGADPVGLASSTIVTFVRLATDPRIYAEPLTIDDAIAAIDALATIDTVSLVIPGPRHYSILRDVLLASRATRNLVPDAALAALAIEHGATIATNDHDFDRFRAARVIYPLEAR